MKIKIVTAVLALSSCNAFVPTSSSRYVQKQRSLTSDGCWQTCTHQIMLLDISVERRHGKIRYLPSFVDMFLTVITEAELRCRWWHLRLHPSRPVLLRAVPQAGRQLLGENERYLRVLIMRIHRSSKALLKRSSASLLWSLPERSDPCMNSWPELAAGKDFC